jgi:hypothetical protein
MSSVPATRLSPIVPALTITAKPRRYFTYECGSTFPSFRSLMASLIIHAVGVWFLAPIVFQAHVRINSFVEALSSTDHTIVYTPLLPRVTSSSKATWNPKPSTQGTLQRSAEESVRATPIASETTPVLVTPEQMKVKDDPSQLASTLTLAQKKFVRLAPQAVEVASEKPRPVETAPSPIDVSKLRIRAPLISANITNVRRGPQPVEIASDRPQQPNAEPAQLPVSSLPSAHPLLAVNAAPNLRVTSVQTITGGSQSAKLVGAPAGPAPSLGGTISGSSSAGANPNLGIGVPGPAVVLNPSGGSRIGSAEAHAGRIAASVDGVLSGRGLGGVGGGPSDAGHRGTSPGEHDNGPIGPGSQGNGKRAGAGIEGTDPGSPVAIESSVVNLDSFGPSSTVHGPIHGQRAPVIIVGSAAAGVTLGRFAKTLKGQVYTIYLNAAGTPAVMQFAEHRSTSSKAFASDLVAPEIVDTKLPENAGAAKQVVSCVLTTEGLLDEFRFLLAVNADQADRLLTALKQWRFRPAYRDDVPVEVDVVIGFGVGTN